MKTWEEYLKQSNHYIQEWEEHHELREVVASLLYDYDKLNNIIDELDKLIEQYSKNEYYYKYNGKYLKSEIINDLKELKEGK